MTDATDALAEATRAAIQAMAMWGLDWHPAYAGLLRALDAHDERVIGAAVVMVREGEAA